MARWIRIAEAADCPAGLAIELVAEDRIIALYNVEGQFYALDGVCSHQGGPLGKGQLCGKTVTCPWHGWQYDVTTGKQELSETIRQPSLAVKVEDGGVFVDLEGAS